MPSPVCANGKDTIPPDELPDAALLAAHDELLLQRPLRAMLGQLLHAHVTHTLLGLSPHLPCASCWGDRADNAVVAGLLFESETTDSKRAVRSLLSASRLLIAAETASQLLQPTFDGQRAGAKVETIAELLDA